MKNEILGLKERKREKNGERNLRKGLGCTNEPFTLAHLF